MTEPIVTTTSGQLRGARLDNGTTAFKGVPYAAPPVGPLRFQPPQPVAAWEGVRDALALGPSCPQPTARPAGWSQEHATDEDCLYLNVWTPAGGGSDDARRPVMFWIHGGGYAIGSGSWPLYDGANLAGRGDVVVVTVNHRLGALGYLHLGELAGPGYESSGNNGQLDLVAALEWVRDNIESFGGDPTNVTVFGESGGGAKISTLLAMPSARGLFHRAAIQSGPGLRSTPIDQATTAAKRFLEQRGVWSEETGLDMDALLAVPVEDLVPSRGLRGTGLSGGAAASSGGAAAGAAASASAGADAAALATGGAMRMGFSPVLDGTVIPEHPEKALAAGTAIDVPLIIGCNKDEGAGGIQDVLRDPKAFTFDDLRTRIAYYGDRVDEIVDTYTSMWPDADAADVLSAILTDSRMRGGSIRLAEAKLRGPNTAPTFMYFFTWGAGPMRSGHGFEIMYVFRNLGDPARVSPERQELADRMSDAWVAFARDGEPNHGGLPKWPAYVLPERSTMILDTGACQVEDDPRSAARELWSRRPQRPATAPAPA
jgi:para-nitrobenzyl esterase